MLELGNEVLFRSMDPNYISVEKNRKFNEEFGFDEPLVNKRNRSESSPDNGGNGESSNQSENANKKPRTSE